jgi:biotin carboxylase
VKESYIYIVGQPDVQSGTLDTIRRLGYKAGILSDTRLTLKNPDLYDRVEKVDFEHIDEELTRLDTLTLSIAGLVCTYENYVVSKAKLGEHFHVPSLSLESAKLCTDKSLMRQAFIDEDPSISPQFTTVSSIDDALAFAKTYGYPLIIKPTNLVKSLLVLRCDTEAQLIENVTYAQATIGALYEKYHIYEREAQLIIEEFIVGKQCSIAAFVDEHGTPHFCSGVVALTNAQDLHVDDNFLYKRELPADIDPELEKEMFRVAKAGVKALKMRSVPAHIELMYGPKGVKIIEIGARIGGYRPRMYKYSYGLDLIEQEVKLAIAEQPSLEGTLSTFCAVYELFPETEGAFTSVLGSIDTSTLAYYRESAKVGQTVGPAKNGYKASAIIIVAHPSREDFEAICAQVEQLSIEVM